MRLKTMYVSRVETGADKHPPMASKTLVRKPSPKIEIAIKFRTQNNALPAPYR